MVGMIGSIMWLPLTQIGRITSCGSAMDEMCAVFQKYGYSYINILKFLFGGKLEI